MNTPSISNILTAAAHPSAGNRESSAASAEQPFNQVLSREISDRSAERNGPVEGAEVAEAAPENATHVAGKGKKKSTDPAQASDTADAPADINEDDPLANASATADMLAMVGNYSQVPGNLPANTANAAAGDSLAVDTDRAGKKTGKNAIGKDDLQGQAATADALAAAGSDAANATSATDSAQLAAAGKPAASDPAAASLKSAAAGTVAASAAAAAASAAAATAGRTNAETPANNTASPVALTDLPKAAASNDKTTVGKTPATAIDATSATAQKAADDLASALAATDAAAARDAAVAPASTLAAADAAAARDAAAAPDSAPVASITQNAANTVSQNAAGDQTDPAMTAAAASLAQAQVGTKRTADQGNDKTIAASLDADSRKAPSSVQSTLPITATPLPQAPAIAAPVALPVVGQPVVAAAPGAATLAIDGSKSPSTAVTNDATVMAANVDGKQKAAPALDTGAEKFQLPKAEELAVQAAKIEAAPIKAPAITIQGNANIGAFQMAAVHGAQAFGHTTEKLTPNVGTAVWDQALGQKVVWMVAGGQQSASLTLNPPDLGPMQVVLNVNNSQASANFIADQPEVRQALEAAMPKLREILNEAGIQLGQATVSAGTPNQNGSSDQSRQAGSTRSFGPAVETADTPVRPTRTRAASGGSGLVDTFA
jgi:flagellar hook-length control protein FliK